MYEYEAMATERVEIPPAKAAMERLRNVNLPIGLPRDLAKIRIAARKATIEAKAEK